MKTTYETVIKAAGGGYEALVTLSGMSAPLTDAEVAKAKANVIASYKTWFGQEPITVAVSSCPVQESDSPGNIPD